MKYGLPDDAIHKICAVLGRYPQVEQAILYGSRAKGNYRKGADIDLTLRGGPDLALNLLYRILDDLLLPYTIDLSIFQNIDDPDLIDHIQRVGVVLYDKDEAAQNINKKTAASQGGII